jgi:hypothetical protein
VVRGQLHHMLNVILLCEVRDFPRLLERRQHLPAHHQEESVIEYMR